VLFNRHVFATLLRVRPSLPRENFEGRWSTGKGWMSFLPPTDNDRTLKENDKMQVRIVEKKNSSGQE